MEKETMTINAEGIFEAINISDDEELNELNRLLRGIDLEIKQIVRKVCIYCNGDGLNADDEDEGMIRRKCPQCKGSGKWRRE